MTDELADQTRRSLLRMGLAGLGAAAVGPALLSACGSSASSGRATTASTTTLDEIADASLLAAARRDGNLNLIAIPDGDGSVYRYLVDGFTKYAGFKPTLMLPSGSSAMEMQAVVDDKGKPTQPDIVDIGVSFALEGAKAGQLTAYRPGGWDDVPSTAKDVGGRWFSSYYGLVSIITNTKIATSTPKTFADLKELPGKGWVAMSGDPRTVGATGLSSAEAFGAVWAAALANGGSLDDIGPGITYFADLAKAGIFDPKTLAIAETIASGGSVISLMLSYEVDRARAKIKDPSTVELNVSIPADGLFPNYYVQGAVTDSPHPSAAKLWLEYLLSDEGALAFMQGGAVSTRFPNMYKRGAIPKAILDKLPDPSHLAKVEIPKQAQITQAQNEVNRRWGPEVAGA